MVFKGGLIGSHSGILLLAGADKRHDPIDTMAIVIPDPRDPKQITHTLAGIRDRCCYEACCSQGVSAAGIVERAEIVAVAGVAHNDVAALCGADAAEQGGAVAPVGDGNDACAGSFGNCLRTIRTAVVGDDDLANHAAAFQIAAGLVHAAFQSLRLVAVQGIRTVSSQTAGSSTAGGICRRWSLIMVGALGMLVLPEPDHTT